MRIKTMTPAMIAALFPPKPKPEEAWRTDNQAEPADLPPPAPPAAEPEPPRVSLVDILREKHAEDQRAATALNAIRLGHAPPAGGLFGIRVGPDPQDGDGSGFYARRYGGRTNASPMQSTAIDAQQPLRIDLMRPTTPPVEPQWFTQPSFPDIAQPKTGFPIQIPQFDFSSSQRDQVLVAPYGRAPAANPTELASDDDRGIDPMSAPRPFGTPPVTTDSRPRQAGSPIAAQVDPQFLADHEDFHQLIGDGRLDPVEHQRVSSIIDRANAYRLRSQQGPIGTDAHQAAASDLSQFAGRLAQDSPRVAAPLAAYAVVHDEAAQRHAIPIQTGLTNRYGHDPDRTAATLEGIVTRNPYDYSEGATGAGYIPVTMNWGAATTVEDPNTGQVIRDARGVPLLWPKGINMARVFNSGQNAGYTDAIAGAQVLFAHNGYWDFQRAGSQNGGINHPEFTPASTVVIGLYYAAAGVPVETTLSLQNGYAEMYSTFARGTVMDTEYTHLPRVNVINTRIGYQIADHIRRDNGI